MKKVTRVSSTEVPNKSLRVSRDKKFLLINENKSIRVYVIGKNEIFKTSISMICQDRASKQLKEIEDFLFIDENKCVIATTDSFIYILAFNLKENDWEEIAQIDLNHPNFKTNNETEELQITAISVSKDRKYLSVSLVTDIGENSQQRKIVIFKIRSDFTLKTAIDHDFGKSQPVNTMFSHLDMNFTANGYQLLLAFEGGNKLGMHIYVINGDKLLLFEKVDYYHRTDFCALKEYNGKIYSIDFDGVMNILDLNFLR